MFRLHASPAECSAGCVAGERPGGALDLRRVQRGDAEAILEIADPAISIEDHGVIDGATYHGRSGVSEFLVFQAESWRGQRVELEELIETGATLVFVVRLSAEGTSSGVPIADEFAHVWELQGGKVRRLRVYRSRADALEAVGLQC